jgi:hypothetical protein
MLESRGILGAKAGELLANRDTEFIVYLDADAIIANASVDLRNALPGNAYLGLVVHPWPWALSGWYWNVGVSYIRNNSVSRLFFENVAALKGSSFVPRIDDWVDNAAACYLLQSQLEWQVGMISLPTKWNCNIHNQPNDDVIVAAWHGHLDPEARRKVMRDWIDRQKGTNIEAAKAHTSPPHFAG